MQDSHVDHSDWSFSTIEYHITDHCNLNCASCFHFAPLASEHYCDIETFRKDLIRIKEIIKSERFYIRILGGEPLLHPDVLEFCRIAREKLPTATIWVVTNGLLLATKDDKFISKLNEYQILVQFTHYKGSPNYNNLKILNQVKKLDRYTILNHSGFFSTNLDLTVTKDLDNTKYLKCTNDLRMLCTCLRNGYIYHCAIEAYNDYLFSYFGIEAIPGYHKEINKISLFDSNLDDIVKFINTPSSFCRYCGFETGNFTAWKESKKFSYEWVRNY